MADGGEDDIGGVARAALEVATAEVPVSLHVANDSFDGRAAADYEGRRRASPHRGRHQGPLNWLSADAYYNVGGETSIDGTGQDNMANTLGVGAGMGVRLWRGADFVVNYEIVVAKPAAEPESQTIRFTIRQLW